MDALYSGQLSASDLEREFQKRRASGELPEHGTPVPSVQELREPIVPARLSWTVERKLQSDFNPPGTLKVIFSDESVCPNQIEFVRELASADRR